MMRNGRGSVLPICASDDFATDSGRDTPILGKSSVIEAIYPESTKGFGIP